MKRRFTVRLRLRRRGRPPALQVLADVKTREKTTMQDGRHHGWHHQPDGRRRRRRHVDRCRQGQPDGPASTTRRDRSSICRKRRSTCSTSRRRNIASSRSPRCASRWRKRKKAFQQQSQSMNPEEKQALKDVGQNARVRRGREGDGRARTSPARRRGANHPHDRDAREGQDARRGRRHGDDERHVDGAEGRGAWTSCARST